MEFRYSNTDITVNKITETDGKVWVGILVDCDIRTIETVVCFSSVHDYHYFAYGCQRMVFGSSLYWEVIKYIKTHDILAEL